MESEAVNGPTHDQQPVFSWTNCESAPGMHPHALHYSSLLHTDARTRTQALSWTVRRLATWDSQMCSHLTFR